MNEPPRVFVVIPAYCAEKSINNVIDTIPGWISKIIVIDDCSTDQTVQLLNSVMNDRLILVQHEKNLGVGGAMISGYREAHRLGADIIVKMDSDGQMDPQYLEQLVAPIINHQADYVKGNRFLHTVELRKMPLIRRIGNIALSFLTKFASGYWNIFDPTNGYTAISSRLVSLINFNNIANGYFFEISLLCELGILKAVARDTYIPAIYNSETSHLSEWKSAYDFFINLISKSIRRITIQYFIRDFNAVTLFLITGLVCLIFSLLWGTTFWIRSAQIGTPATTGTVMIAVIPLILGFQFCLQAIVMDVNNTPSEIINNNSH
jgi:dolichol-phosphate mannosyltransferase